MIPDRYTLQAWAREGVYGLADWLYGIERVLYEDVLGHPPVLTLGGEVLYDDGQVRLKHAPKHSPTGRPYRLQIQLAERAYIEVCVSAAELQQLTRRFNDHLVALVFEKLGPPGDPRMPWDGYEEDAIPSF